MATAKQEYLHFLALDLLTEDLAEVRVLLRAWTEATARMTEGKPARGKIASEGAPPYDAGKTFGLFSARRKLTFGFGPTLFERDVEDRFGLAGTTPGAWTPTSGSRATTREEDPTATPSPTASTPSAPTGTLASSLSACSAQRANSS